MDLTALKKAIDAASFLTRGALLHEGAIAAFERTHGITLPATYRRFVQQVGDGIDSDGVPLSSLANAVELLDGADPATPFPYDAAFAAELRALLATEPTAAVMAREDVRARQHSGMPPGCIVLGDFGGGEYSLLVVTGDERGRIWRHGDVDCPESAAHYAPGGGREPLDVAAWLSFWAKENGLRL